MSLSVLDMPRLCLQCGYDLRGTQSNRCPECGTRFERTLDLHHTPYLQPGKRSAHAFWATVILATLHPARIADDAAHPANLAAALRFRRALAFRLAVWPILLGIAFYVEHLCSSPGTRSLVQYWYPDFYWQFDDFRKASARSLVWSQAIEMICVAIVFLTVAMWIFLALGVQTYFFHPRRLPEEVSNRAVALGYFTVAPLAWMPAALLASITIMRVGGWHGEVLFARLFMVWLPAKEHILDTVPLPPGGRLIALSLVPAGLVAILTARSIATIVRRTTHSGMGRPLATVLVTALAWPSLFVAFPVAIALALILLQLIGFSLAM